MLINIDVEKAWEILRNITVLLQQESVPLLESLHRVAAVDLVASGDLPPDFQSAVDGFVIHKNDLQGDRELLVGKAIGPGEIPSFSLDPGNTVKVVTGGVLPEGSAAVIPQEEAEYKGRHLFVKEVLASGSNVKIRGEDFKKGEILLHRHKRLTPGVLGVLAAFGQDKVTVCRRPSAAIICLGPEIVPHYCTPKAGQVRDSNGPLLASLIIQDGGRVSCLEYMGKDFNSNSVVAKLKEIYEKADLVITIGGAFGDSSEQIFSLLGEAGAEMLFWGILAKPGSHSGGGIWGSKPVIALSGNASACAVGYHLLASPVLRKMQGLPFGPEKITAVCVDRYQKNSTTRRFLRGRMFIDNGSLKVKILPGQKSSMLKSLLGYNSLIDLQAGHPVVEENSLVEVIPLYDAVSLH